jgi:aryl-alcohol dehydrogenase-like predicted oxidoreductase
MSSTSLDISDNLGFGCVGLSAMGSYFSARAILDQSFRYGIRHFDTAPLYGRGYSELILGSFISSRREQVTIATKFGLGEPGIPKLPAMLAVSLNHLKKLASPSRKVKGSSASPNSLEPQLYHREIGYDNVVAGLQNSLARLGTHYIDYYFLHEGIPSFLTPAAFDYLLAVKQKGIVKKIGLAVNAHHLMSLNTTDVEQWDVLQYEGCVDIAKELMKKYPLKEHIHHSCLKSAMNKANNIDTVDKGGYVLSTCVQNNRQGKVLFSTKSAVRLKQNIEAYKKYTG